MASSLAKQYHWVIRVYCLLLIMQWLTSTFLFLNRLGAPSSSRLTFQFLKEKDFPSLVAVFSAGSLYEVIVPHFAALGLIIFILGHFIVFVPQVSNKTKWILILTLSSSAAINLIAGLLMRYQISYFILLKGVAFLIFQIILIRILWILIHSTFALQGRPLTHSPKVILKN